MLAHLVELRGSQSAWFVQNVFRNCQLTNVVQQRGGLQTFHIAVVESQFVGQFHRIELDSADVTVSNLILGIDCHRQGFDGRQVQLSQFGYVLVRSFDFVEISFVGEIRDKKYRNDNHKGVETDV